MERKNTQGLLVDGSFVVLAANPEDSQLIELLLKHASDKIISDCRREGAGEAELATRCSRVLSRNAVGHAIAWVSPLAILGTPAEGGTDENS